MMSAWRMACLGMVIGAAAAGGTARADPIIYVEQAIASGSLGAVNFTDSLVTITLSADTQGVVATPFSSFLNTGVASVSISGVGSAAFVDPLTAFVYAGPVYTFLGITEAYGSADLLDTGLAGSSSYRLTTSLAALSGSSLINPFLPFATKAGDLDFVAAGDSTFSAAVQAVPEPASLVLLLGATAMLIGMQGRRRISRH